MKKSSELNLLYKWLVFVQVNDEIFKAKKCPKSVFDVAPHAAISVDTPHDIESDFEYHLVKEISIFA